MKKIFFFLLLALFSCKDYGNPVNLEDNTNYTYLSNIQPIFNENCIGCHYSGSDLISYESHSKVISNGSVIPESSESSSLFNRINLPDENSLNMPFGNGTLSIEEIELIEKWINDGAVE